MRPADGVALLRNVAQNFKSATVRLPASKADVINHRFEADNTILVAGAKEEVTSMNVLMKILLCVVLFI
jgi:hypothetical protein